MHAISREAVTVLAAACACACAGACAGACAWDGGRVTGEAITASLLVGFAHSSYLDRPDGAVRDHMSASHYYRLSPVFSLISGRKVISFR